MKKIALSAAVLIFSTLLHSQTPAKFERFFLDQTLRIDYYHVGDAAEEIITIDQVYRQGPWAGNPEHLLDPFNTGRYFIKLYDVASNALIHSRGFDSYFGEYKTTEPAKNGVKRTYHETALLPCPAKPVFFVIEMRDRNNLLHPLFTRKIDPAALEVIKENPDRQDNIYPVVRNGDAHKKVDIVMIAEGYSAEEEAKFNADLERYAKVFFEWEPYKSKRKNFNISGIFRPSRESGVDEPERGIFKNTALNSSFNSLGSDRYLLTEDNKTLRDVAAQVPYDAIFILVNSKRYGGGGIYNFFCITTVDNEWSEFVFQHEFGHSFTGLADEYYGAEVAYDEFFPVGVEPTEANITALLDPPNIKWKELISPGVAIPTDWGKAKFDSLYIADLKIRQQKTDTLAALIRQAYPEATVKQVEARYDSLSRQLNDQIKAFTRNHPLKDKVGAFEGGGYVAKGIYRPMLNCLMLKFEKDDPGFCKVCEQAVNRMIEYYSE